MLLTLTAALKAVHVLLAAVWFGSLVGSQLGVRPALAKSSPATRKEFGLHMMPLGVRLGNIFGGLTLLSGIVLLYAMTGSVRPQGEWGRYMTVGLLLNLAALYLLNFAVRPSMRVIAKLMEKEDPSIPPPAAVGFLQKRLAFSMMLTIAFIALAMIVMVVADVTTSP